MNEVTRILSDLAQGDAHAAGQLLPLVYEELRKLAAARMAAEAPGNTLNATALVHEAYLRLVGSADAALYAAKADGRNRVVGAHTLAPVRMALNPGVESRLRLLQQDHVAVSGLLGSR